MKSDNLEKAIELEVEEFFYGIDEEILEKEDIDPVVLSDKIYSLFKDRILEFSPTPLIGDEGGITGSMICPKCYRPHGKWKTQSGGEIDDSQVSKAGNHIIITSDY